MSAHSLLARLGLAFGLAGTLTPAQAVPLDKAPPAWVDYAKSATMAITGWLNADRDPAAHMRKAMTKLTPRNDQPLPPIALSLWVSPSGAISRIEAPSTGSADADADLRILLLGKNIKTPPKGMLQPMRLAIRLAAKSDETKSGAAQ
ncbi:MAG TPA: hypothetical protein VGM68_12590 [Rhizomicrobium sp.]|jgi:hypothetical protein